MAVQKRIAQLGLAKQTAKGSAAANPAYTVGLSGGQVYDAEIEQSELPVTWSDRNLQGHDRISTVPMFDGETVATPKMIGLMLLGALGSDVVTGSGPYTHTITSSTALPYLTAFGVYGSDKVSAADVKIDSLELTWDRSGALRTKVKGMGCAFTIPSTWVIGSTGEVISSGSFAGSNSGVFQVDGATARIVSGSVKIENKVEAIVAAASVTPDDVFEAMVLCTVSLTIKPDDMTQFRKSVTGSTSGTSANGNPTYGSTTLKWGLDANTDLQFVAGRVGFISKMPAVDPAGGAAEIVLEGTVAVPVGGGNPFTFTLRNTVASY